MGRMQLCSEATPVCGGRCVALPLPLTGGLLMRQMQSRRDVWINVITRYAIFYNADYIDSW